MKYQDVTEKIIGVFYEVYNELGHGFLESVYEQAMMIALSEAGLHVDRQLPINVHFRGQVVGEFRADIVVNNQVIVEIKAARAIESAYEAQIMHYLRATDVEIGLLMNFGPKPEFKRFIYDNERKNERPITGHGSLGLTRIK
jgi:GxxExxY protein